MAWLTAKEEVMSKVKFIALLLSLSLLLLLPGFSPESASAQKSVAIKKLPFSAARKAGNTLYISGQIARTADGVDVKESVAAETRQVMDNIERILKENGYSFDDVVRATVFLTDIEDYHEMNKEYGSYFKSAFPARAGVGGVELVFGFRVEISCIAYKEGK